MEADESLAPPCIYRSTCGDCSGRPAAIRVHLRSGEVLDVEHVVDVQLTEDEIILRAAEGPAAVAPPSITLLL